MKKYIFVFTMIPAMIFSASYDENILEKYSKLKLDKMLYYYSLDKMKELSDEYYYLKDDDLFKSQILRGKIEAFKEISEIYEDFK